MAMARRRGLCTVLQARGCEDIRQADSKFPEDATVACKEAMLSLNQLRSCEEADAARSGARYCRVV